MNSQGNRLNGTTLPIRNRMTEPCLRINSRGRRTVRTFGCTMPSIWKTALLRPSTKTGKADAPFIVNVDDDESGDQVQVFIG